MSPDPEQHVPREHARTGFTTTHWTVVLRAGQADTVEGRAALETLCQAYWYPLYAYARRRGCSAHDAEDLVQGFFARLVEKRLLGKLERVGGRFRSFLLTSFQHFISDEHERASSLKRGGGHEIISLNAEGAEEHYQREPAELLDPEKIFERRWALTLLERVLRRLKSELEMEGRGRLFDRLQNVLVGEAGEDCHAAIGAEFGLSKGAVAVTVHRLRRRYRLLLTEEIAQTVADTSDVESEMRSLQAALRG